MANKHIAPFLDAVLVHLYKAQADDEQKVSTISRLCQELIKTPKSRVFIHHEWFISALEICIRESCWNLGPNYISRIRTCRILFASQPQINERMALHDVPRCLNGRCLLGIGDGPKPNRAFGIGTDWSILWNFNFQRLEVFGMRCGVSDFDSKIQFSGQIIGTSHKWWV